MKPDGGNIKSVFSLEKKKKRDVIVFKYLKVTIKKKNSSHPTGKNQDNRFKLKESRYWSNLRKNFQTLRTVFKILHGDIYS